MGDRSLHGFLDPISSELMVDAVVTPYGHTFSERSILLWLKTNNTCPLTRRPLRKEDLKPNYAMREAIEEWCKTSRYSGRYSSTTVSATPAANYKVIVFGASGCGKTNLIAQFVHSCRPNDERATVGADLHTKTLIFGNRRINVEIWDTAGQERYRSIVRTHYRNAHGALLVYDISSGASFDQAHQWLADLRESEPDCVVVLVGNKSDLSEARQVSSDEARQFVAKYQLAGAVETSAKSVMNVDLAFRSLVLEIDSYWRMQQPDAVASDAHVATEKKTFDCSYC